METFQRLIIGIIVLVFSAAFALSVTDLYYSYFPDPDQVFAKTSSANTGLQAELDRRDGEIQRLQDRNASLELKLQRAEIYFRELSMLGWGHFGPGAGFKAAGGPGGGGGGSSGGSGAGGSGGAGAKGGSSKAAGSPGGGGSSGTGSSSASGPGIGTGPTVGGDPVTEGSTRCRERMRQRGVVLGEKDPCVDISEVVKQLAMGTYVFNKPNKAYVGLPFNIALALKTSPEQNVDTSGSPGIVTERRARFSQSLEASLRGDDMTVKPEGGQARTATLAEPVFWEWTVTPQTGGKKILVLEVVANIQVGPERHRVQINTLREPIEVTVSNFHRIKTYVADANGFVIAAGATIPALGVIVGLVPPIRSAIVRFWRWLPRPRRARRH